MRACMTLSHPGFLTQDLIVQIGQCEVCRTDFLFSGYRGASHSVKLLRRHTFIVLIPATSLPLIIARNILCKS